MGAERVILAFDSAQVKQLVCLNFFAVEKM